jgi:uncharacterized protein (TIGR03085 family)
MTKLKYSLVTTERAALASALEQAGPNQPTLCAGWETKDLLAHLIIRERRPDAAAGIIIPFLKRQREQIEAKYSAKDFGSLIELFRSGPGLLSPFAIPQVDNLANLIEFVIHYEDVRRAQPNWRPRTDIPELQTEIRKRLPKFSLLALRKSKVGLLMVDQEMTQHWLKRGRTAIEIHGEPIEILLYLSGRQQNAQVSIHGSPAAIATFERNKFGL